MRFVPSSPPKGQRLFRIFRDPIGQCHQGLYLPTHPQQLIISQQHDWAVPFLDANPALQHPTWAGLGRPLADQQFMALGSEGFDWAYSPDGSSLISPPSISSSCLIDPLGATSLMSNLAEDPSSLPTANASTSSSSSSSRVMSQRSSNASTSSESSSHSASSSSSSSKSLSLSQSTSADFRLPTNLTYNNLENYIRTILFRKCLRLILHLNFVGLFKHSAIQW